MGERQGKKLHTNNTNGGLIHGKENAPVFGTKRRSLRKKKPHLAARPGCCSEDRLWDGDGQLRAVGRASGNSRDGEGVGAGLSIGDSSSATSSAAASASSDV